MRLSPDDRFIVEAGSNARKALASTAPTTVQKLRQSMKEIGNLHENDSSLVFTSDYLFESVTAAAGVVCGFSVNGRKAWKTDAGETYGEWEAAQSALPPEAE